MHDSGTKLQVVVGVDSLLGDGFGDVVTASAFKLSGQKISKPTLEERNGTSDEREPHSPCWSPESTTGTFSNLLVEVGINHMLEILTGSDLVHDLVLVPVDSGQSSQMVEDVVDTIGQLIGIDVSKTESHMRVDDDLDDSQKLSYEVECVTKPRFLSFLGGQGLGWLQVEVVVEVQIRESTLVKQQVEHVVASPADSKPGFDPVDGGSSKDMRILVGAPAGGLSLYHAFTSATSCALTVLPERRLNGYGAHHKLRADAVFCGASGIGFSSRSWAMSGWKPAGTSKSSRSKSRKLDSRFVVEKLCGMIGLYAERKTKAGFSDMSVSMSSASLTDHHVQALGSEERLFVEEKVVVGVGHVWQKRSGQVVQGGHGGDVQSPQLVRVAIDGTRIEERFLVVQPLEDFEVGVFFWVQSDSCWQCGVLKIVHPVHGGLFVIERWEPHSFEKPTVLFLSSHHDPSGGPSGGVHWFDDPGNLIDKCNGTRNVVEHTHFSGGFPWSGHVFKEFEQCMRHVFERTQVGTLVGGNLPAGEVAVVQHDFSCSGGISLFMGRETVSLVLWLLVVVSRKRVFCTWSHVRLRSSSCSVETSPGSSVFCIFRGGSAVGGGRALTGGGGGGTSDVDFTAGGAALEGGGGGATGLRIGAGAPARGGGGGGAGAFSPPLAFCGGGGLGGMVESGGGVVVDEHS